jgi:DNA-binding NarL/FixJ family response regulator
VITIGTVKNHVTHIFEKLGVNDRLQALIKYKEMNT